MTRFALRIVLVLFLVSGGTFMITALLPGDPALTILGPDQPPERYQEVRDELGLDHPLAEQYAEWLSGAVTGDLGDSLLPPGGPVVERVGAALPISVQLAGMAVALAIVVSLPLAMVSAWRAGSATDRTIGGISFGVLSTPSFLLGLLLIIVFVNQLHLLPRARWVRLTDGGLEENLRHALLPMLTVALPQIAVFTRVLRSDLITTLQQDYVLAARARGLPTWRILTGEALRPSSLSLVTLVGLSLGQVIASTVIVEVLFSLPGMGSLIVDSAGKGDVPVVQGAVLVIGALYVLINATTDVVYGYLDPRSRHAVS